MLHMFGGQEFRFSQQQQHKQQQRKKKQIQDDDDDDDDDNTVITEITQKSSLEDKDFECNLIDDKGDTYGNNIVLIPTQVIFKMSDEELSWKWKSKHKRNDRKKSTVGK